MFSEREDPEVASAVQLIWEKYAVNGEQVGGAGVGGAGVGVFGILLSNKVKAASASKANALCYSCACSLAHDNRLLSFLFSYPGPHLLVNGSPS